MEKDSQMCIFKKCSIILLGDTEVGKTSIFNRYINDKFEENNNASIGVEFTLKSYKYKDKNYSLQIFDTAGQERFRSITQSYYRLGDGVFIIFDLTNKKSLDSIKDWIKSLNEFNKKIKIMILGNKDDLDNKISDNEINNILNEFNMNYLKVSAKNGNNIDKAFNQMIELIDNDNITEYNSINLTGSKNSKSKKKTKVDRCC